MSLKSLTRNCNTPNAPGAKAKIYAVESDKIATFPDLKTTTAVGDPVTLDGDIVLEAGAEWAEIEFQVKTNKARGTRTGERGAGGGFDNFFEGFLPGVSPAEMELVSCFNAPCGMVVIVQQKDENLRVIGNPDEPAFADVLDWDTGLGGDEKAGTQVSIGAELNIPAPFYEGTITPIN